MDFTISIYKELLSSLMKSGYKFKTLSDYFIEHDNFEKIIILRNDIDLLPQSALVFANIQAEMGIKSSFYFRSIDESWDKTIIQKISDLSHEVGYHYENMDTCNGDLDKAWDDFRYHLDQFRQLIKVQTICMHGSPLSKWDNRELWKKYNYRKLDIIAEPYFDIDVDEVYYLTDTGRRWNGEDVSIRDKVTRRKNSKFSNLKFHSTIDIINAVGKSRFPGKAMINTHPQRWHNNPVLWTKELIGQSMKNVVKRFIIH